MWYTIGVNFWSNVDKSGECWEWQGNRTSGKWNYGIVSLGHRGERMRAHRFAWELAHGSIPEGMSVLHHCDNPPCVRHDHLFLGTQADNLEDMDAKGRRHNAHGAETHCPQGHPYNAENTYNDRRGWRQCRPCTAARMRRRRAA